MVVCPASDNGVEAGADCHDVLATVAYPYCFEFVAYLAYGIAAGLDKQFPSRSGAGVLVVPHIVAEEVKPRLQVDDVRLFRGEGEPAFG